MDDDLREIEEKDSEEFIDTVSDTSSLPFSSWIRYRLLDRDEFYRELLAYSNGVLPNLSFVLATISPNKIVVTQKRKKRNNRKFKRYLAIPWTEKE